jgi:REP element-mobilizing transposase RayT
MKLSAYIFMPDHVHLLVRALADTSDLLDYEKAIKQRTGLDFKAQHGTRLWQPSFYDHVLRGDEEEYLIIRYMVLNPVKAGLVQDPADYPFWGTADWTREEVLRDVRAHAADVWQPPEGYLTWLTEGQD